MISQTENNAVAFVTTKDELLDLFFILAESSPSFDDDRLRDKVLSAARVDPEDTLKILIQARDCRGGKGIRCQSMYALVVFLIHCRHKTHVIEMLTRELPQFGRYRDMIEFYLACTSKLTCQRLGYSIDENSVCKPVRIAVVRAYVEQLRKDFSAIQQDENASITLAAKWLTSEKKKNLATFYEMVARTAFPGCSDSCARFRKEMLNPLRRRLALVETRMSEMNYQGITYSQVPSKAMSKYVKAFRRNDGERHQQFLDSLNRGETTIKGGRLYPHDIVRSLMGTTDDTIAEQLEHQWESMVRENVNTDALHKTVVVCDVSASMIGTPMDVSIALGVLISSFTAEPFRGHVITFSATPTLHALPMEAKLSDKVSAIRRAPWGANTDIIAVFRLILDTVLSEEDPASALPETLIILSDMQFDEAIGSAARHLTPVEVARSMFSEHALAMPNIVFWNLRSSKKDAFPVTKHDSGACLLAGPSPTLLNALMLGNDISPDGVLKREVLDNPRYEGITYPSTEF